MRLAALAAFLDDPANEGCQVALRRIDGVWYAAMLDADGDARSVFAGPADPTETLDLLNADYSPTGA